MFAALKTHYVDIDQFKKTLNSKPEGLKTKYLMEPFGLNIMDQHWSNKFYGGSVFSSVRNNDTLGTMFSIANSLEYELNVDSREQSHEHQYFVLENLIVNNNAADHT